MKRFNVKNGYSLAEALITMTIIVLLILAVIPMFVGKRSKRVVHIVGKDDHGIVECPAGEDCEIELPKGEVRDVFVIATGGGGGGAGSYCGESIQRFYGDKEKTVNGSCKFENDLVLYMEASAAGGGSSQGFCDKYPGIFKAKEHEKNCKIFPKTQITINQYEETKTIKQVYECRNVDDTDSCKTYKKNDKGEYTTTCETYNKKELCQDWDTNPAEYLYGYGLKNATTTTLNCDLNQKSQSNCLENYNSSNPSKPYPHYKKFPNIGEKIEYEKVIDYGSSEEAIKTKRADVCEVDWVHAPEVATSENRYCNAALFGGIGGKGEFYEKRLCPAGKQDCGQWRGDHAISSSCNDEQLNKRAKEKGCPYGAIKDIPTHSVKDPSSLKPPKELVDNENALADEKLSEDKILDILGDWLDNIYNTIVNDTMKAIFPECNAEKIRQELNGKNICGHNIGEFNCYVDHSAPIGKQCNNWKELGTMTTAFEIGYPGKGGPFNHTMAGLSGKNLILFKAYDAANIPGNIKEHDSGIINMPNDVGFKGGGGGSFSLNGTSYTGVSGGKHTGISGGQYGRFGVREHNTLQGKVGYVQCKTTWTQQGLGGSAGVVKSGYIKHARGKVVISAGKGGAAGDGTSITKVIIDLVGSLAANDFPAVGTKIIKATAPVVFEEAEGKDGEDTVVESGSERIVAQGGIGGKLRQEYEKCSAGSSGIYNTVPKFDVNYEGKAGGVSETGLGNGGNGNGTAPGQACMPKMGEPGKEGGAIVFY